jgi:hypothetical protein
MSLSKFIQSSTKEESDTKYHFIRIARLNTDLYDYITVGYDATKQVCFHRNPELTPNTQYLLQMKDTGMFGYIDVETNCIRLLDPEYDNDIYHFFYMEFSLSVSV